MNKKMEWNNELLHEIGDTLISIAAELKQEYHYLDEKIYEEDRYLMLALKDDRLMEIMGDAYPNTGYGEGFAKLFVGQFRGTHVLQVTEGYFFGGRRIEGIAVKLDPKVKDIVEAFSQNIAPVEFVYHYDIRNNGSYEGSCVQRQSSSTNLEEIKMQFVGNVRKYEEAGNLILPWV